MTDPADHSTDEPGDGTSERRPDPSETLPTGVEVVESDDDATIRRAVDDAAADGGGTVLLSAGEHRLEGPVALRSGVRVRGMGVGTTVVSASGEDFAAFEGFGSTEEPLVDLAIEDLAIDCSELGGEDYATGGKCIYLQYVRRCRISGVYAHGAPATGIGTDFMLESLVHGCIAEGNGRSWAPGRIGANGIGIGAGRYAAETVVSDCHAVDNGNNGNNGVMFEAQSPTDEDVHSGLMSAIGCTSRGNRIGFRDSADRRVKFVGCSAARNDEHGIVVSGKSDTSRAAREHRIADCHVVDDADHGVAVQGAADRADLAIDDCTITGNGGRGVSVDAGSPVGGLSIADCAIHDNGDHGVLHRGGGRDVSITGCGIHDDASDGIRLEADDGAYRGISILANRCHGHPGGGIALYGPHEGTIVLGNSLAGNAEGAIAYDERPDVLRENVGYPTETGGRTTVADGDRIDHGLAEEPAVVTIEPRSPARAFVRTVDDERIVVGLVDPAGESIHDAEPVFWEARAY